MGIFKKKSKIDKGQKEDNKKQEITISKPTPTPQPYRPKHAASDAIPKPVPSGINGKRLSKEASDYASAAADFQHPLANNSNHPFAQAQQHPFRSPSTPLAPYKGFNGGFNSMQRNNSAEVFTTDPEAPPMPIPSQKAGRRTPSIRNGNGYAQQLRDAAQSFDGPMAGNGPMASAVRERGYGDAHFSADSGYGSEGHSRAPSEHGYAHDTHRSHLLQDTGSFLPEMSLSDELAKEPAWSEASFGGESPSITPRAVEENNSRGYFSHLDPVDKSNSIKSKTSKIAKKQTRFEEQTPAPIKTHEEMKLARTESQTSPQSNHLPEPVQQYVRPESSTIPQPNYAQPARTATPPPATYDEPGPFYAAPVQHATTPPQRLPDPQPQYSLPARTSTPPPTREYEDSISQHMMAPVRTFSPPPQQHQQPPSQGFAPLERILSQRSNAAHYGSLEGYKVNKRGTILDEEGEVIGRLIDGDIIDCVRQRCNAHGEVLDDRGRVVGRVQATDNAMDSPVMHIASPVPSYQHHQQHFYLEQNPQQAYHTQASPSSQRPTRRESTASQQDVFTPAWQRQSHSTQSGLARELRDHMNAPTQSTTQAVAPLDFPGNVAAVELDGSEQRANEEEVLPLFDHSDVFMPVPFVPARSPRRSETPSPPTEKVQHMSHQPPSATHSQFLSPAQATRSVSDSQQQQQKHISAPPASRYLMQPAAQQQGRPTQKGWAAAELIEQTEDDEPEEQNTPTAPSASSAFAQRPASASAAEQAATPRTTVALEQAPAAGTVADTAFALRAAAVAASPTIETFIQSPASATPMESTLAARAAAAAPPANPRISSQSSSFAKSTDSAFAMRAAAAAGSPLPKLEIQQQPDVMQQVEPPQQQQQQQQQPPRRGILRSASDASVPDQSKSYSRPTMSPVPEDGSVSEKDDRRGPALFAYKGDIPAEDGPISNASLAPSRAMGAKSPPLPNFPRQAFTGGSPNGTPFAPMNSAQFSSAGGLNARTTPPRQFSTGVPSPRTMSQFPSKNSFLNAPLKRSPLSSHEITPPESDQGSNDGERSVHNIGVARGMHSRQPSFQSTRSTVSTATKPRTYFTHGGKVTVDADMPPPSQQQAIQQRADTDVAPSIKSESAKKKSRFSLGFGKKG